MAEAKSKALPCRQIQKSQRIKICQIEHKHVTCSCRHRRSLASISSLTCAASPSTLGSVISATLMRVPRQFRRLAKLPVLRPLNIRPANLQPEPMKHQPSLVSALPYRCGEVAATVCLHCARDNDRYLDCVSLLTSRRADEPFLDDLFHCACANCLSISTTSSLYQRRQLLFSCLY